MTLVAGNITRRPPSPRGNLFRGPEVWQRGDAVDRGRTTRPGIAPTPRDSGSTSDHEVGFRNPAWTG